jgi:hypothetical protein
MTSSLDGTDIATARNAPSTITSAISAAALNVRLAIADASATRLLVAPATHPFFSRPGDAAVILQASVAAVSVEFFAGRSSKL